MSWRREAAWRRIDEHGEERCVFVCNGMGCVLEGMGAAAIDGSGLIFEYRVELDSGWRFKRAGIVTRLGNDEFRRSLELRDDGQWLVNGAPAPQFEGCTDVDLSFTPSTNTIAIRRLALPLGGEGVSRAVWIAEPELALEGIEQHYRRIDENRYEYAAGSFSVIIDVDEEGVVLRYPERFQSLYQTVLD